MATIETIYTGDLRTEATHVKTGNALLTDAPTDNHGRGETFSPTDLLAASLGSCMLTIMGIKARDLEISIDGTNCSVTKIMAADPRRVGEIQITFDFPAGGYTDKQKTILQRSALSCPVAESLHPDLKQTVLFNFADAE